METATGRLSDTKSARAEGLKSGKFLFEDGTVLYSKIRPYLKKVARPDFRGLCSADVYPLTPADGVLDGDWLYHLLLSEAFTDYAIAGSARAGMPKVNRDHLFAFRFDLPELPEQQRVVAILDEAFAAIATARGNTEKNVGNARLLFDSELNAVFEDRGSDWIDTTLEEVLETQPRNGWSPPAANHAASGTPVITLTSVTGFVFKSDAVKYTSAPTDPQRHYWVKNGDLLISRSNTPELVGHVAVADGLVGPTIYPDLIMRMVPDPDRVLTAFLYYQLRTDRLRNLITSRASGANPTMKKINKSSVQTLPVSIPPLTRQRAIATRLQSVASETASVGSIYQEKREALDSLRQSILQSAFSGDF